MPAKVQIEFSDGQLKSMDSLRQELGIRTKREVVFSAITLLQWVVAQIREGRSIFAKGKDNNTVELSMPWMSNFPR